MARRPTVPCRILSAGSLPAIIGGVAVYYDIDSHTWSVSDLGGGNGVRYTDLSLMATPGAFSLVLALAPPTVVMIRVTD